MQSTAESAEASLELCRKCQVLEPRLGNKTYSMLVERLLRKVAAGKWVVLPSVTPSPPPRLQERRVEEGRQLLEQLTREGMLPSQVTCGSLPAVVLRLCLTHCRRCLN